MSKAETASTNAASSSNDSGITFKRPEGETSSEISYVRLGTLKAGDIAVEGIYLGSSANALYPEKQDFKFKTMDGKTVVVNEGGNLKFRMQSIASGTLVRINYLGMQEITKGPRKGKKSHNVDVLVAE